MIKRLILFMFICVFALTGCKKEAVPLPAPEYLYGMIAKSVELPEMIDLPLELFTDYYGINLDWVESAVSYSSVDATLPDEIVIVKAVDENAAVEIKAKLEARLECKEKSAENYFVETVPTIRDGVVRQDGLTVSLLVTKDMDAVSEAYD